MRLTERPRRLADVRGDVAWPAELQAVLDRALERDASRRYTNAAEFGRDFARAVERMPESVAATAGTVVMGAAAAGGATAVVPATRVDDASAAGRRVSAGHAETMLMGGRPPKQDSIVAPKSRTAILVAASVLVVLGIGAAALQFVAADGAAPAAGAGESQAPVPAPAAGTVRPMGEAVTPVTDGKSPGTTDINAELADILESIADERSASRAIARIDALAADGRLPRGSEEHLWSQYARAKAYLLIGREADGCTILAGLKGRSARPTRNDAIDATFSAASCQ